MKQTATFSWSLSTALAGAVAALLLLVTSASAEACASIAAQVASEQGGRLLSVSSVQSDGRTKCHVTILIQSGDQPPRKKTIVVEQ
jgi:hypothetical protein